MFASDVTDHHLEGETFGIWIAIEDIRDTTFGHFWLRMIIPSPLEVFNCVIF